MENENNQKPNELTWNENLYGIPEHLVTGSELVTNWFSNLHYHSWTDGSRIPNLCHTDIGYLCQSPYFNGIALSDDIEGAVCADLFGVLLDYSLYEGARLE